jgi:sulfur relay (sulfurtransferase) complex TusBCD TusD component (DsrE family)
MSQSLKLGIMISAAPGAGNFSHGLNLAAAALKRGVAVYIYIIANAVGGLPDARLQRLRAGGAKVFACAYSLRERGLENDGGATLAGLTILNDLIASTDRFVSFN